jgi:predicted transglutaminase-like cysteine proteinase
MLLIASELGQCDDFVVEKRNERCVDAGIGQRGLESTSEGSQVSKLGMSSVVCSVIDCQ